MRSEMLSLGGRPRRVVGFAILIEVDGERMLIFSDEVAYGSFSIEAETVRFERVDEVIMDKIMAQQYELKLIGSKFSLRKEQRRMGNLLLEDQEDQEQKDEKILPANREELLLGDLREDGYRDGIEGYGYGCDLQ